MDGLDILEGHNVEDHDVEGRIYLQTIYKHRVITAGLNRTNYSFFQNI